MLKFKDLDNKCYEVHVKNKDLVIDIKMKLSKEISKHYKNIIFMFKNEILFDDKLISDYKIGLNQFVLWFEGEDCVRFSHADLDIIKCVTIIDNHNDYQYFVNMNKRSTVRMLKSIIADKYGLIEEEFYLEFNKNNLSINDNCKSLEQFGLSDGCRIELFYRDIIKLLINNKYLNKSGEILAINLSKYSTIGRLKQICAERTNIKLNEIVLQFNEKCLFNDDATLDRSGLIDECNIDLVGGEIISVTISYHIVRYHDSRCHISVNNYSTVGELKQLFCKKTGISSADIHLDIDFVHNGTCMSDYSRLIDYGICEGDTIIVEFRVCGGGPGPLNVSMIALSDGCGSFTITGISDMDQLITEIISKIDIYIDTIDHSLINLYSDANKINQITNLQDLYDNHSNNITIYYEFVSRLYNFELIEKLEKGAFGQVYKYRNKNTNLMFALKKFDFSKDSSVKRSFQIEVNCYLKLKPHPRIIKYEKHFIEKHKSYILMEYMERGSLASYVKSQGPFSELSIARYVRQILEGLEYLHDNKILHRDLKGDNILLDENDNLKLCDFGLAKILTDISSKDFLNGVVQSTVGTVNWMSPEMINGKKCGPPSDIWSFGATMVEMITRKHPHKGLALGKIVQNIQAGKMNFHYPANSSDDIKSFINSCLQKKPRERARIKDLYQSSFLMKVQA